MEKGEKTCYCCFVYLCNWGKDLICCMRQSLPLLLVLVLATFSPMAQVLNTDSLLRLLPAAREDTSKVHLLFSLSDQFENAEPEKAKHYAGLAGALSKKLNFEPGTFRYYRQLSYIYAYQSKYDSVLHYNKLMLEIAKQKRDTFYIGVALFNIGESYKFLADYNKGLQYTLEGVKLLEGKGYTSIEANLYGGLQGTYLMLKQYDKAIGFGLKAVELGRKQSNKSQLVSVLTNLANGYGEIKNFPEAKKIYEEAIAISRETNNTSIEAMCYEGLADVALKENNMELLKQYAEMALLLHTAVQNDYGVLASKQALALYHLQRNNSSASKQYATEALKIATESNFLEGKAEVLNALSGISFAMHEFINAFNYADESKKITEKIFTEAVARQDASLRIKYETEKKDNQIKLQQAEIQEKKIINYLLIAGACILFLISLLGYRNYRNRQKIQQQRISELETEKQLTAAEAVLKGEEQERSRLAKDLHDGLGGMLSGIKYSMNAMKENLIMTPGNVRAFERSMDMLDSSIKEMRRVAHNMMPESLVKFGLDTALKDFCNEINQTGALRVNYQSIGMEDAQIEQTTAITIYRIVQELINNTMKHAAAATAIVQVSMLNRRVSVTVEDDGDGFDPVLLRNAKGIGWVNILSRVDFLKGTLDIQSSPGSGTSVHIELDA